MTVLEYFDYEKQLLKDYDAVKTPHAKIAVFKTLMDTLDTHRDFVYNTISSFDEKVKDMQKGFSDGKTPEYVKDMMAEFGFHELEEAEITPPEYIFDQADYDKTFKGLKAQVQPGTEKKKPKARRQKKAKCAQKDDQGGVKKEQA